MLHPLRHRADSSDEINERHLDTSKTESNMVAQVHSIGAT
jgi:hypothetical protein